MPYTVWPRLFITRETACRFSEDRRCMLYRHRRGLILPRAFAESRWYRVYCFDHKSAYESYLAVVAGRRVHKQLPYRLLSTKSILPFLIVPHKKTQENVEMRELSHFSAERKRKARDIQTVPFSEAA